MKTWFGLLIVLLRCGSANADAVTELSQHLGEMPALVVVVCGADEGDLSTIADLVEQTPWKLYCQGSDASGLGRIRSWARQEGLLGARIFVVDLLLLRTEHWRIENINSYRFYKMFHQNFAEWHIPINNQVLSE